MDRAQPQPSRGAAPNGDGGAHYNVANDVTRQYVTPGHVMGECSYPTIADTETPMRIAQFALVALALLFADLHAMWHGSPVFLRLHNLSVHARRSHGTPPVVTAPPGAPAPTSPPAPAQVQVSH